MGNMLLLKQRYSRCYFWYFFPPVLLEQMVCCLVSNCCLFCLRWKKRVDYTLIAFIFLVSGQYLHSVYEETKTKNISAWCGPKNRLQNSAM